MVLSPALNRPAEQLRDRLPIGPAEECVEKLAAYQDAGAQRVFMWPLEDELEQHDEWVVGRRYLTPAILTFNEALPEADLAEATAA